MYPSAWFHDIFSCKASSTFSMDKVHLVDMLDMVDNMDMIDKIHMVDSIVIVNKQQMFV